MKWKFLLSICLILMLTLSMGMARDMGILGGSSDGDAREAALAGGVASGEDTEETTITIAGRTYQAAEEEASEGVMIGVITLEEEDETSFRGVPSTESNSCGSDDDCGENQACFKPDSGDNRCVTCYDSDDGSDAYTAGVSQGVMSYYDTAYYGTEYAVDTCTSNNQVQEWFCFEEDGNTHLGLKYYDCPFGCADGACIAANVMTIETTECNDLIDNDAEYVEEHPGAANTEDTDGTPIDGIDAYGICILDGKRTRCTSLENFDESSSTNIANLRGACGKACIKAGGDYIQYDPQCAYPERDHEINTCSDGRDNDEDGLTDYPADPGCNNYGDDAEQDEDSLIAVPIEGDEEINAPIYEGIVDETFGSVLNTRTCDTHSDCGLTAACGNTGYCVDCRETDGGSNVYTQGFYQGVFYINGLTISGEQVLGDTCGADGLVEFYCQESGSNTFLTSTVYECNGDCEDGACTLGTSEAVLGIETGEEETTFSSKRELGRFLGDKKEDEVVRIDLGPEGITLEGVFGFAKDSDNNLEIAGVNFPGLAAAFENFAKEDEVDYSCSNNYDCVEAGKGLVCDQGTCVNMCNWKLIECSNGEDDDGDGDIDYFGGCDTNDDGKSDAICGCFAYNMDTEIMELITATNNFEDCGQMYFTGCVDLESGNLNNQMCQGDYYPADAACTDPLYVYEGGLDNQGNAVRAGFSGVEMPGQGIGLQRAASVGARKWWNPFSWGN